MVILGGVAPVSSGVCGAWRGRRRGSGRRRRSRRPRGRGGRCRTSRSGRDGARGGGDVGGGRGPRVWTQLGEDGSGLEGGGVPAHIPARLGWGEGGSSLRRMGGHHPWVEFAAVKVHCAARPQDVGGPRLWPRAAVRPTPLPCCGPLSLATGPIASRMVDGVSLQCHTWICDRNAHMGRLEKNRRELR